MASTKDSASAHPSTPVPDETRSRVLRGMKLFLEHGHEIERALEPAVFFVPGCSGGRYEVSLGIGEDRPSCSCPDFERRQLPCKHIYCLVIWTARRNRRRPATPRRRQPAPEFAAA